LIEIRTSPAIVIVIGQDVYLRVGAESHEHGQCESLLNTGTKLLHSLRALAKENSGANGVNYYSGGRKGRSHFTCEHERRCVQKKTAADPLEPRRFGERRISRGRSAAQIGLGHLQDVEVASLRGIHRCADVQIAGAIE